MECQFLVDQKKLPTKPTEIHKTLQWCDNNFSKKNLTINHGMLAFLLPMGKEVPIDSSTPQQKALRLQYGSVNHNSLNPNVVLEIANNLAGDPMNYQSRHDRIMDKDFELVFYQSNEVQIIIILHSRIKITNYIFHPILTYIFFLSLSPGHWMKICKMYIINQWINLQLWISIDIIFVHIIIWIIFWMFFHDL